MLLTATRPIKEINVYNFENIKNELCKHGDEECIDIINIQYVESMYDPDSDYNNGKMESYYKVFFIVRYSEEVLRKDKENQEQVKDYIENGPTPGTPEWKEAVAFAKFDTELSVKDAQAAKIKYIKDSAVNPADTDKRLKNLRK